MKDKNKKSFWRENRRMIIRCLVALMFCITLFSFFIFGSTDYEGKDDAKRFVLENHTQQTGAMNAVTAIYLNYRLWDTIFEAMLLLISAMAVKSLSWSNDDEE